MFKKLGILSALLLGSFSASYAADGCCPPPCEQPTGDCYCRYVRYEPYCYMTKRCVDECVPCPKKCVRYVPQYYQVQKCRYVPKYFTVQEKRCRYVPQYYCVDKQCCRYEPEYYCETKCRQVPECYDVCEYKTCRKEVCEPRYTYIPRSYWKHECKDRCN